MALEQNALGIGRPLTVEGAFAAISIAVCVAASPDYAQALFDRGVALDNGKAAHPDAAAAFVWYKRAAEAGSAEGAFNVGVMYDAGRGVAADPGAAALWYAVAAAGANPRAAYNLGELFAIGDGVPENPGLAAAWLRRAAALGVTAATEKLRSLERRPGDRTPANPGNQDAPGRGPAPPAATLLAPLQSVENVAATDSISLVWTAPAWPNPEQFMVEVASISGDAEHDVFTQTTPVSALRIALSAGQYAWRVFSIDLAGAHYTASPWVRFAVR